MIGVQKESANFSLGVQDVQEKSWTPEKTSKINLGLLPKLRAILSFENIQILLWPQMVPNNLTMLMVISRSTNGRKYELCSRSHPYKALQGLYIIKDLIVRDLSSSKSVQTLVWTSKINLGLPWRRPR